jgi:hypothetical protein
MTKTPPSNRLISDDSEDIPTPRTAMPATPSVKPSPTRSPRTGEGRGPYPGRRQVTAHIDRNLFLGLKAISAQTEKPMVELFEEALQAYVASVLSQKKFGQS